MVIEAKEVFSWLDDCEELCLKVQGNSMCPFLHSGTDTVTLKKPGKIKKGDIVVFERNGYYIMHRVIKIDGGFIDTLGDNLDVPETHIPVKNIAAIVTSAQRKGKTVTPRSIVWLFFSKVYIHMTVRKLVWRLLEMKK